MTVGANSYGTAADVAALTKRYTVAGVFDTTTTPTLAQVEALVNQVSAMTNAMLARQGFTIPVTQADCILLLAGFVTLAVADLVMGANGSGRYASTSETRGIFSVVNKDIQTFIDDNAAGLEALGAARTSSELTAGMDYRSLDDRGNALEPLFQRAGFGWDKQIVDWDAG